MTQTQLIEAFKRLPVEGQLAALEEMTRVVRTAVSVRNDKSEARRREALERVVGRMKANPIPSNAPRFTRDQLHERR
jgi:hypothetical protein